MKKLLFLLGLFCILQAKAQTYSISFSGAGLSTVQVQNLTSGVIVDVPASDVLRLSITTGLPEINNNKGSGLKVYPNPMTDKSTLEIHPPVAGDAIISVCDMTGRVLTQFKVYVENSSQEFSLSGIKSGLHIINVQGTGYQFSEKILSNGKSNGTAIIAKVSNNPHPVGEKKTIEGSKGVQTFVDMDYNNGERLKYTAVSGNNRTVMTDIPIADNTITFTFTECKDGDNIYYPVVQIGSQLWMAENLKTTSYRNGDLIGTTTPATLDISAEGTAKYQWAIKADESNVATYGRSYTWDAVTDSRGTCPTNWHLPSDVEWTTLENYLIANGYNYDGSTTGNKIAKSLAGTTNWNAYNDDGAVGNSGFPSYRNKTGFTAVPSGGRYNAGVFLLLGNNSFFWSSTENPGMTSYAFYRNVAAPMNYLRRDSQSKSWGYSVRCLRD